MTNTPTPQAAWHPILTLIDQMRAESKPFDERSDYDQALEDARECLEDIYDLIMKFPIAALQEWVEVHDYPPAIREGLDKIIGAACVVIYDGEEVIGDFIDHLKAQGEPA